MNWIKLTKGNKPQYEKRILVKYDTNAYDVTYLIYDDEYACDLWVDFETYNEFEAVTHFCYITAP